MTTEEMDALADIYDDEMLRMDGYDDCCIGVVERFGMNPVFCYSVDRVIAKLMKADGMTEEEAWEFFHFNQIGAWVGDGTPCFISHLTA